MLGMNSNVVVLILKTINVVKISYFRPIALANFRFKIISKILADMLPPIADRISPNIKRGFLKVQTLKITSSLPQKPSIF